MDPKAYCDNYDHRTGHRHAGGGGGDGGAEFCHGMQGEEGGAGEGRRRTGGASSPTCSLN